MPLRCHPLPLLLACLALACGEPADPAPVDAACPETPPPLAECVRGAFFADCGGDPAADPSIWCNDASDIDCVWTICPPADFTACADAPSCGLATRGWDAVPWTRARDMVVAVEVDPALVVDGPALACEGGDAETLRDVCAVVSDDWWMERGPAGERPWGWPGVVTLQAGPDNGRIGSGWSILVEVDPFAAAGPRARVCLVPWSDADLYVPPICATAGRLALDRMPATVDDVAGLAVELRAVFPDFERQTFCGEDCVARGLTIDARF